MAKKTSNTRPKPYVFVLMPFKAAFNDIYKLGIKEACKGAGAYCERVDEQVHEGTILDRIYNQINKADLIVADLTESNPNVFYETGYAHALGKPTILLIQEADKIPFDLKQYPFLIYEGNIEKLKNQLRSRVKRHLEEKSDSSKIDPTALLVPHLQGFPITANCSATFREKDHDRQHGYIIQFSVHNPTNLPIPMQEVQFGFVFPREMGKPVLASDSKLVRVSEDRLMMVLNSWLPGGSLYPKGWIQDVINIAIPEFLSRSGSLKKEAFCRAHVCECIAFSQFGARTIPFTIWIEGEERVPPSST
ncbi:hypothetical protein ACYOEI_05115 [Singulisphaera rosea]